MNKLKVKDLIPGNLYSIFNPNNLIWNSIIFFGKQDKVIFLGKKDKIHNGTKYDNAITFFNVVDNKEVFLVENDFESGFYCEDLLEE